MKSKKMSNVDRKQKESIKRSNKIEDNAISLLKNIFYDIDKNIQVEDKIFLKQYDDDLKMMSPFIYIKNTYPEYVNDFADIPKKFPRPENPEPFIHIWENRNSFFFEGTNLYVYDENLKPQLWIDVVSSPKRKSKEHFTVSFTRTVTLLDLLIFNDKTNKKMYGEVKNQQAHGNAHERVFRHATPSKIKYYRYIGNIDKSVGVPVLAFMTGEQCEQQTRINEIKTDFPYSIFIKDLSNITTKEFEEAKTICEKIATVLK